MAFGRLDRSDRSTRRRVRCGGVLASLVATSLGAFGCASQASASTPIWLQNGRPLGSAPQFQALTWGSLSVREGTNTITCVDVSSFQGLWNEAGHGLSEGQGVSSAGCKDPLFERVVCSAIPVSNCAVFLSAEMPVIRYATQEGLICRREGVSVKECPESELERRTVFTKVLRRPPSTPWSGELATALREAEAVTVERMGIGEGGRSCYPEETVVVEGKEVERPVGWEKVPAGCFKVDLIAPRIPDEFVYYGTLEPEYLNGSKSELFPSSISFTSAAGTLISSEGTEATLEGELRTGGAEMIRLIQAQ